MSLPSKNLFLASLTSESRDHLLNHATAVTLPLRTPLYKADQAPAFAYFMTSGLASVVTTMVQGGTAEVGVIGNEGIVGSMYILGSAPDQTRCFMQLPGTASRIPLAHFHEVFRSSEEVRDRVL